MNVIFRYSNADFSVAFPSFLDILMYFLGYSFTAPWIFFRSLQISWATLYIIFQTYD